MGQTFAKIPDEFAGWFEKQPVFFVATAPADPETHINVSPRGLDTFRVLDANRVAWLDLTGSGVETITHLKADGAGGEAGGRITLMFCAFEGSPRIVRLYGRGQVRETGDDAYDELRPQFPDLPGERAIIDVAVDRVSSSCGFGVPLMEFVGGREELVESARRKGEAKMAAYRARKNTESIDGLPGLEPATTVKTG
jgi:pyridoxamine 5'-phosphate oxidase-like protein